MNPMSARRILVIEDDAAIRRAVVDALTGGGYRADGAGDGESGLQTADSDNFDLVLLDLILPGIGGLEVLAGLRESQPTTPVIILTAMGDEADRVRGLQLGADDYVVKPFSVRELLARVEAVLRRTPTVPAARRNYRFPMAWLISPAAKYGSAMAAVRNSRNGRRSCCGIWRPTPAARFRARNRCRVCGV